MEFFDAHTHVQFSAYDADREEVIHRALDSGVQMVNVGTQLDTSRRAIELAEEHESVYAAVGLHPIHTHKSYHDAQELGGGDAAKAFTSRGEEFNIESYRKLAVHPKVVAIGECGLDYYRLEGEDREVKIEKQKAAFSLQVILAREVKKPLMIHCRGAFPDLISILKGSSYGTKPGIAHFFSGTANEAQELLELGFSFTFGGVITFAREYDEVISLIPLDRILSETDAPYVAPTPYRGKRNEPAYVVEVVKKLAELKNVPVEKMAEQIALNAKNIFANLR